MLILWRSERELGRRERAHQVLSTLVGLWRIDEADGRTYGQVPAPFDSLVPLCARRACALGAHDGARAVGRRRARHRLSVLFGLVGRRRGRLHGLWYVHRDER